jgi:hypothetical protein
LALLQQQLLPALLLAAAACCFLLLLLQQQYLHRGVADAARGSLLPVRGGQHEAIFEAVK